jgi:hypothetical protein
MGSTYGTPFASQSGATFSVAANLDSAIVNFDRLQWSGEQACCGEFVPGSPKSS